MQRIVRLLIAYDGGGYHGWQRQRHGQTTVQEELETRLTSLCGECITLHGAGRTDAGVHALGMVAHFRTTSTIPVVAFFKGTNSMLPPGIRIMGAEEAEPDFHSRFSALGKTYRYDFFTGPIQNPTSHMYSAHCPGPFAPQRLQPALDLLVGTHDFSSFERTGSRDKNMTNGRGAVRTLTKVGCFPQATRVDCWSIRVTGDGFLRQMVRILAGTLIEIGQGKRSPDELAYILAARDRATAGVTAPACGLFLEKIHYRNAIFCR